jgi:hypothetical protein
MKKSKEIKLTAKSAKIIMESKMFDQQIPFF